MNQNQPALELLNEVLDVLTVQQVSERTGISRDSLNRYRKCTDREEVESLISLREYKALLNIFPSYKKNEEKFDFVDLFAGIGGIRKGFEAIGGRCVFTSEWNKYAIQTYMLNYANCENHKFIPDIKSLTQPEGLTDKEAVRRIRREMPDHDVLLAGFPCQPFSLAGVSKKNSLGRSHGFECEDQGQLFFDITRILRAKKPSVIVLENVKNLKSHDKGITFKVICEELEKTGYWLADIDKSKPDPKVIDGQNFLPQHRERIVLVGIRKDLVKPLGVVDRFSLQNIKSFYPAKRPTLMDILDPNESVNAKYTLSPKLWQYLYDYAAKHKAKGNGFGYGKVVRNETDVTRTLSARYHKDGSEILIDQSDMADDKVRQGRPRRLTPQECARLMGFTEKGGKDFEIPVSDTQAYRQFGNSVVVPVFSAVAQLLLPYIEEIKALEGRDEDKVA